MRERGKEGVRVAINCVVHSMADVKDLYGYLYVACNNK